MSDQDKSGKLIKLLKDMMLDTGQVDTRKIKILEVTKLRGAERHSGEEIKFEIKPSIGIQILPFVKVKI